MNMRFKESTLLGTSALLMAGLFLFDIYTPLSFSLHALYTTVILVATASRFQWLPSVAAGISTILTVLGGFLSRPFPTQPMWITVGNRTFTIIILWILVWFAMRRHLAETAVQNANEGLERNIKERTRNLDEANQALVSEIMERMQTEHAFRLSEGRLAGILDIAEDAIIVMDDDRTIALFNRGAVKLFGYGPDEILGQLLDQLLPERFRMDHSRHIEAFSCSTESARRMAQRREVFGLKKDGTEFPAEASISKLTVGEKTTFTVILRDITERLRTERQLQSLTTQLMTAQDEERRRISRELHDDINQRLALLAIEMGRIETTPSISADAARHAFHSLAQRLASISDDVRRMAYQFHPSILDDLGLSAAIKYLADEFSVNTGIKTVVVQEEIEAPLPQEIASCLYRITQESLSNVTKHAQASRVELELTCDGQEVILSVHDSGVGFDLELIRTHHLGLGLVNMRERVRSVHGRLEIQAQPGRGTHIIVQIPLPGAHDEHSARPVS